MSMLDLSEKIESKLELDSLMSKTEYEKFVEEQAS